MSRGHENPIDVADVSDGERADMLAEYLDQLEAEFGVVPKLLPLDEEGKAPIIQGKCKLDSPKTEKYLIDGRDAVEQIREEGARGFAIYAGKPSHHTGKIVLVDHDDLEAFPVPTADPTLTVMSGSGRGSHETYRNGGDVENAKAKGDISDAGEIRAYNWYCVTPGSIHPTGGVYHVTDKNEIATLSAADLPDELKPGKVDGPAPSDDPIELKAPDELESAEFENEHGESLEEIRSKDDKLDALLSELDPSDYDYDSPSEADAALVPKLHWWRFTPNDIGDILRKYRNRDSLREDKITRTVKKYARGEQCESPAARTLGWILKHEEEREESPEWAAKQKIGRLLGKVEPSEFPELRDRAATVLDVDGEEVDQHRGLEQHRQKFGPVLVENGRTWVLSGVPLRKYELLNFELDVESFLRVPGEPLYAKLRLRTMDGEEFTKTIEPKIFSQRHRFDDEVLAERFGMTFDPGPRDDDEVLDDLNKYISRQDAPTLRGTHHMGLHGDEWVTPEGSITPDGWAENPETVYLERNLAVERRVRVTPDQEDYDRGDVATILRKLPYTRDTERFLSVLGWFYAAPFRPHIYDWEGEFNLLNITGGTGSGKTTSLRYLWRCFGLAGEPFDCWDTKFVLLSTLAATNSFPIWFDEYKPGDARQYRVDTFHDSIRKAATGSIAQRGNADQTTTEYELQAPVVISGEQQIQPPAERRRSILTTFKKDTTDADAPTSKAYKELAGEAFVEDGELQIPDEYPDPTDHALAYLQFVTDQDPDELRELWYDARREVMAYREGWEADLDLDDLEIQGLQTVVFGWRLFTRFSEAHGVGASALPGDEELEAALRYVAGAVGPEGVRKSHEDRYLELFSRAAAREGYLERGKEYEIIREGRVDEEVRIHVDKSYDVISKFVRDHALDGEDLLGSADAYRSRFEEGYERDGGYVVSYSQKTPPVGRCIGIRSSDAASLTEFDPDDLEREEPFDKELYTPTTAGLQAGDEGMTVEGRIDDVERDTPDEIHLKATLVDKGGSLPLIAWCEVELEEGEHYRIKGARVDEKDGAKQLYLDEPIEVEKIQPGAGNAPPTDAGDNARLTETAADGGQEYVQLEPRILEAWPKGRTTDANEVAGLIDEDTEAVRQRLEKMAQSRRDVVSHDDGTFERLA